MTKPGFVHIVCAAAVLGMGVPAARGSPPLPRLGAVVDRTTVSGFSSGAYMAGQFAVAYSSIVAGAGLVAGGPYFCTGEPPGEDQLRNALTRCMNPVFARTEPPDAQVLWQRARQFAAAGLIDDTANLARQRIILFNGGRDHILTRAVTDQAHRFHDLAGAQEISYVRDNRAGHGMITSRPTDNPCGASYQPFFNHCGLALARGILSALSGPLRPPARSVKGRLQRFGQAPYAQPGSGLSSEGYVFLPKDCVRGGCAVHVAFHGCWQNAQTVGDHFYGRAGYNETADTNRIIVLYPQASSTTAPFNPNGCWDYWGYTGTEFFTRSGLQLAAVRAMLARLAER